MCKGYYQTLGTPHVVLSCINFLELNNHQMLLFHNHTYTVAPNSTTNPFSCAFAYTSSKKTQNFKILDTHQNSICHFIKQINCINRNGYLFINFRVELNTKHKEIPKNIKILKIKRIKTLDLKSKGVVFFSSCKKNLKLFKLLNNLQIKTTN